jgi:FG-GAP repeat
MAITAGDFNGDGLADLGVGVPTEDVGSTVIVRDAGAVAVLSGAPGVLRSSPNLLLVAEASTRTARARFGAALSP